VTDNSHAFLRLTITTTDMIPRFCPGDTLILQRVAPDKQTIRAGTEIACTTSDGTATLGTLLRTGANGITLSRSSPEKRIFIGNTRNPILYRVIGLERYRPSRITP
tara:strand:- start:6933 stop:7250 length:318 start_codon:yes stop_codon:yes gene_type:complete